MSLEEMQKHNPEIQEIMSLGLYVAWGWEGCGFGELYIKYDPDTKTYTWDTEAMSVESIRKILHAVVDHIVDKDLAIR
jgi:hypothetical protein